MSRYNAPSAASDLRKSKGCINSIIMLSFRQKIYESALEPWPVSSALASSASVLLLMQENLPRTV